MSDVPRPTAAPSGAGRVVVTGGAGFLGSHLCRALLGAGREVVCVDNLCTGRLANVADLAEYPGFRFVEADVTEPLAVGGPVSAVAHLACAASPVDYFELPVATLRAGGHGTYNMLELAREKGARFLLASTSEVYGDPLVHPQTEEYWGNVNPVGPRAVYDESKRFSEAMTVAFRQEFGLDTGIARIFNSYGPSMRADDGRVVPTFITRALRGEPLPVMSDGRQTRSLCYVDDTVDGLITLLDSAEAGPVNLGNPHEVTVLELAGLIVEITGSRSPLAHVAPHPDDPRRRRPDIGRARSRLGWEPRVALAEGLKRTVEWFALTEAVRGRPSR
ncbi:GDP-mannose 4,6-dehydratase [Streptomyces roseirectus]|uniref:GDP-mannose 4,6-dehydratase n=1 Tax=Streptomyces roseirectus TaxID=2768066 RepID=A0A7H0IRM1_9ACTN|nr:NAD-dependent epimerase/dehydratase family protein [Streptomyces roseirectus]QNP75437.1 GDP-mannose 4,6-dehydratase [Streptomyces roseirectus]